MKSGLIIIACTFLLVGITPAKASIFDDPNNIHKIFLRQHDAEGRRVFNEERLNLLIEEYSTIKDSTGLFFCHLGISLANTDQDKVKMIDHIVAAYAVIPNNQVKELMPYLRLAEMITYYYLGKYQDALNKAVNLEGVFNSTEQKPEPLIANFYHALSLAVLGDFKKAQALCDKTKEELHQMVNQDNDVKALLDIHLVNTQGLLHTFQAQLKEAEECFKKGIEMAQSINEGRYIANFNGNLANIYLYEGEFEKCLEYAYKDLSYSLKKNDKRSQFGLSGIFAEAYYKLNKPDSTKKYIDQMLALLPLAYDSYFVDNNRNFLLDYYIETNQPKELAEVTKYFNRTLDSLTHVRVEKDYEMIKSQIDLESAQEQIDQLKRINNLEKQKNQAVRKYNIALLIGFVAILLFIYFMYRNLMTKKKQNALLELKNEEINLKNEELLTQKEDIVRQSERIYELNKLLEQKVDERTKEIVQKNKKLSDYAFHNSHHIRGPLARILGIIGLWDRGHLKEEEKVDMLKIVESSAKELDRMVREVNKMLE